QWVQPPNFGLYPPVPIPAPPLEFGPCVQLAEMVRQVERATAYATYVGPLNTGFLRLALLNADIKYFITVINCARLNGGTVPNAVTGLQAALRDRDNLLRNKLDP